MSSVTDHYVRYHDEHFLSGAAASCRKIGVIPGSTLVNLQIILDELQEHGVESIICIPGMKRKGRLTIEVIEDDPYEFPAYVTFEPTLTLHVQRQRWLRFKEGRSKEQVIIAHEIGHILLHGNEAKPYVGSTNTKHRYAENEYFAEWQADRFADHLLIPTEIAVELNDVERIAFKCNVPDDFAFDRLKHVQSIKKKIGAARTGEPCPSCGEFALVSEIDRRRCHQCGYSGTEQFY